jgi:hypothetical protein
MKLIKVEMIPYVELPECPICQGVMQPKREKEIICETEQKKMFGFTYKEKIKEKVLNKFECRQCHHEESYDYWLPWTNIKYKIMDKQGDNNEPTV